MSTFKGLSAFKLAQNLFKCGKVQAFIFQYARNYRLDLFIFKHAKHALITAYSLLFGADIVLNHAYERT